jgi:hypothetical protein
MKFGQFLTELAMPVDSVVHDVAMEEAINAQLDTMQDMRLQELMEDADEDELIG